MITELYEIEQQETVVTEDIVLQARVILFNDEIHTFEEVTHQIILAINCGVTMAEALTYEVHFKGKAVVFDGALEECMRVSAILEEIALNTQLEF
jgi:ATP-dependent Clp protease adaptor protein ClpS